MNDLITSVKNPKVLAARALETAKGRRARNAFLCDGEHMVSEAVAMHPQGIQEVFVEKGKEERYAGLLEKLGFSAGSSGLDRASCPLYTLEPHVMEALSQVKTSQGIAAVVSLPPSAPLDSLGNRLVLLENVQDPGNVGTILRTLDAAGFHGCVLTVGCADPFAPKTLRATMGSVFRVPLALGQSGPSAMDALKAQGYALLAAELNGEPFYQRGPLPEKLCLMIGSEGPGLTPAALAAATHRYRLPMQGGAESLNAAVAAAVLMYDIVNR